MVDVDPDALDLQFRHIAEANICLFESEPAINPAPKDAIVLFRGVHPDVLLDAVPSIIFEIAQLILPPNPGITVPAGHVSVIAVETYRGLSFSLSLKLTASRPSISSVTRPSTPTAPIVRATDTRQLTAPCGVPIVPETKIVAKVDFFGLAARFVFELVLDARTVVFTLEHFDLQGLFLEGLKAALIVLNYHTDSFPPSARPVLVPLVGLEIREEDDIGIFFNPLVRRILSGQASFGRILPTKRGEYQCKAERSK